MKTNDLKSKAIDSLNKQRESFNNALLNLNPFYCIYEFKKKEILENIKIIDERIDKLLTK